MEALITREQFLSELTDRMLEIQVKVTQRRRTLIRYAERKEREVYAALLAKYPQFNHDK